MYLCGAKLMQHTQIFSQFKIQFQIMERKTVLQHLCGAVLLGYEWAPDALKNMFEYQRRHMIVQDVMEVSLQEAISTAFIWGETKEGHDYWAAIRNNPFADLKKILNTAYN